MLVLATGVSGCDSAGDHKGARVSKDYGRFSNTISYESFGTTSEVDCASGKSLDVAGSNNKLTVRGRCESVDVRGADNRITIERVDKTLTITGFHNAVSYRGGEPKVDDRGSGNTITERR